MALTNVVVGLHISWKYNSPGLTLVLKLLDYFSGSPNLPRFKKFLKQVMYCVRDLTQSLLCLRETGLSLMAGNDLVQMHWGGWGERGDCLWQTVMTVEVPKLPGAFFSSLVCLAA